MNNLFAFGGGAPNPGPNPDDDMKITVSMCAKVPEFFGQEQQNMNGECMIGIAMTNSEKRLEAEAKALDAAIKASEAAVKASKAAVKAAEHNESKAENSVVQAKNDHQASLAQAEADGLRVVAAENNVETAKTGTKDAKASLELKEAGTLELKEAGTAALDKKKAEKYLHHCMYLQIASLPRGDRPLGWKANPTDEAYCQAIKISDIKQIQYMEKPELLGKLNGLYFLGSELAAANKNHTKAELKVQLMRLCFPLSFNGSTEENNLSPRSYARKIVRDLMAVAQSHAAQREAAQTNSRKRKSAPRTPASAKKPKVIFSPEDKVALCTVLGKEKAQALFHQNDEEDEEDD